MSQIEKQELEPRGVRETLVRWRKARRRMSGRVSRQFYNSAPGRRLLTAVEAHMSAVRLSELSETRARATELWQQGKRRESLELLRSAIASGGADATTWHVYGARLLEFGSGDAAFEAIKSANQLDPSNLDALELLLEMFRHRKSSKADRERALARLATAVPSWRERDALSFFIPHSHRADNLRSLSGAADAVVRAVAGLDVEGRSSESWRAVRLAEGMSAEAIRLAEAIYALGRGRNREALFLLDSMHADELPKRAIRLAVRRALAAGKSASAHGLLEQYLRVAPGDAWALGKYAETRSDIRSDRELAKSGFSFPAPALMAGYNSEPESVMYTVYNSLPYHSAGYATRTHGLVSALNSRGWGVRAVSRLGYPFDTPGSAELQRVRRIDRIGSVEYVRLDVTRNVVSRKPLDRYVRRYADALTGMARTHRPAVLHGASNYVNGIATVLAARELGVPSVYEVRGLWEVTRASRDPQWGAGEEFAFMARMETEAAKNADHVIAITAALRDELVRRGVAFDKISIVPNGVNPEQFSTDGRDRDLAEKLGIGDRTVIGYVGSVLDYEGLDLLVEAARLLSVHRRDFVVLIVGDGPQRAHLESLVEAYGLETSIRFIGRVPHDEVAKYYSLIDIAPFPRHPLPVTEMVSPLKPFEAMAMGKAVVASDVAALAEIVSDGVTGRLHVKGDAVALANVLEELLSSSRLRLELGEAARAWVRAERSWERLAESVSKIYTGLTA